MKKIIISVIFLIVSTWSVWGQRADYNVVPRPQSVVLSDKPSFCLDANTRIAYPEGDEKMERNAHFLREYIQKCTGLRPALTTVLRKASANTIWLVLDDRKTADEGYTLTVDARHIIIAGKTAAGVFYGIQTLRKSLPVGSFARVDMPTATVVDFPRFAYRGMMLDCGRHFLPVSFVKEFIDLMAMHNMNRFHWHLTEDQGWRIEIKKYPLLTAIGSVRRETCMGKSNLGDGRPYGGYYTQDQAREIVEYARQRHITVIPEIDMPGHQLSTLASYPYLGCTGGPYEVGTRWGVYPDILCFGNELTYQFCEDVLSEMLNIFPSPVFHIGGDEVPTKRVAECPKCKELMAREHLTLKTVQGYFTNRIEKFLNAHGRRIMGWDEILEGDINRSAIVHCWRDLSHGVKAAQQGHDVVMSPTKYCYLDYYQTADRYAEPQAMGGNLPLETVFNMVAVPDDISEENRGHILGIQANLWTEFISNANYAEYMLLPRMAAVSENAWVTRRGGYQDFMSRITRLRSLYDAYGLHYARHAWNKKK